MPKPPMRKSRPPSRGNQVWTATVKVSEEHQYPTLYVLTADDFHFLKFEARRDQEEAADAVRAGEDPREVAAQKAISVPLDDILRVEKTPGQKWFYVQAEHDGRTRWECINCPEKVAGAIFQALRSAL